MLRFAMILILHTWHFETSILRGLLAGQIKAELPWPKFMLGPSLLTINLSHSHWPCWSLPFVYFPISAVQAVKRWSLQVRSHTELELNPSRKCWFPQADTSLIFCTEMLPLGPEVTQLGGCSKIWSNFVKQAVHISYNEITDGMDRGKQLEAESSLNWSRWEPDCGLSTTGYTWSVVSTEQSQLSLIWQKNMHLKIPMVMEAWNDTWLFAEIRLQPILDVFSNFKESLGTEGCKFFPAFPFITIPFSGSP